MSSKRDARTPDAARRYEISVLIGPCSQEEATDLMVEIADFADQRLGACVALRPWEESDAS